jgi:hypothetical protein
MFMSLSSFGSFIGAIEDFRFSEAISKIQASPALFPGRKELCKNSFDK